jgi:antitoxin HigA-1
MRRKLPPVHPGDILKNDFLEPMVLSANRLAKEIGVAAPTVNEIVRGKKSVTAEMALRLARYFNTTPALWMNLQMQYDIEVAEKKIGRMVGKIAPRAADPNTTLTSGSASRGGALLKHRPTAPAVPN